MKKVAIIGSTGSIGTQAVDIIEGNPDRFIVTALAARSNVSLIHEQARRLKPRIAALFDEEAAHKLDGMKLGYGDAAFAFHVLPRVPLAVIYWRGDEDFPANCQILFDASASHYLPTDLCAILGSMLTRKLLV